MTGSVEPVLIDSSL